VKRGLLASVLLTTLVCLGIFGGVVAAGWTPRRGLDLAGGLSVVFQPTHNENVTASDLSSAVGIMNDRVNSLGVSGASVSTQGNDIVVELPGVTNAAQALKVIGTTAQLYFRPVIAAAAPYVPPTPKKGQKAAAPLYIPSDIISQVPAANKFTTAGYDSSTQSYSSPPAAWTTLSQYASNTSEQDTSPKIPVLLDDPNDEYGARLLLGPAEINNQPLTGVVVASANAAVNASGQWTVNASLTGSGSTLFNAMATQNLHLPLANDLGGSLVDAPVLISNDYSTGLTISQGGTGFTQSFASQLALVLNYGALPIQLQQLNTQIVSPTLGSSNLHAGLIAGLVGLLLVMLYMILYYRALGIVVLFGLLTTGALIYGLISMLGHSGFGLTLDLSGITGLIVSVGITVDSYVVYFERLKDEIRAGRTIRSSVDRGFKSAYRTVLSADAVSFLGALVLWLLSIGSVKGFAFYLGLSTLIDVATAYLFTRPFVILLGRNKVVTDARFIGIARGLVAPASEVA
jgi:preprotein translocase subunit SecD